MFSYLLAGLAFGGVYAIASVSLTTAYRATGTMNLAFGALAYLLARMYYFLNSGHGWSALAAGVLVIGVVSPALGFVLWAGLFRHLMHAATLVQVVATVGLSVALLPVAALLFGDASVTVAPGFAPSPPPTYEVFGVPITLDQVLVLAVVAAVVVIGWGFLRFTRAGLSVRAVVDSQELTSLAGVNPQVVAAGVWMVNTVLAGLAGVLLSPLAGLDPNAFVLVTAAAFAAVVAARLDNVPVAFVVALLLGVATGLAQYLLNPSSTLYRDIVPSLPFVFVVIFGVLYARSSRVTDRRPSLAALAKMQIASERPRAAARRGPFGRMYQFSRGDWSWIAPIAVVAALPLVLSGLWQELVGLGALYALGFLSYTLITGEAGIISLCQITFAGIGAVTAAQLAANHGWPVMLAALAGGLVTVPIGLLLGLLTIHLGDIYVVLVTLTFGLFVENLIFPLNIFFQFGNGVPLLKPGWLAGSVQFDYFALALFVVFALGLVAYRRSTGGLALSAVRWSEPGARSIGLGVAWSKIVACCVSAFIAGIAGSMLALYSGVALTSNFATLLGLVWISVLVMNGSRSAIAALVAGMSFAFFPAIVQTYLPPSWGNVPTLLFGLGAIEVARHPAGFLAESRKNIRAVHRRFSAPQAGPGEVTEDLMVKAAK